MNYLQNFKYNEILRGRLNKGVFKLKPMHQNASLDPEDVEMPTNVCDPLKIIDLVKGDISAISRERDSEPELPLDATRSADDCEKGHYLRVVVLSLRVHRETNMRLLWRQRRNVIVPL